MEARLAYLGHALIENRVGLLVDARITRASGHAERVTALVMIEARADRPSNLSQVRDRAYPKVRLSVVTVLDRANF